MSRSVYKRRLAACLFLFLLPVGCASYTSEFPCGARDVPGMIPLVLEPPPEFATFMLEAGKRSSSESAACLSWATRNADEARGYAIPKVISTEVQTNRLWGFVSLLPLLVPAALGVPMFSYTATVTMETELLNSEDDHICAISTTGRGKAFTAAYWGFLDAPSVAKARALEDAWGKAVGAMADSIDVVRSALETSEPIREVKRRKLQEALAKLRAYPRVPPALAMLLTPAERAGSAGGFRSALEGNITRLDAFYEDWKLAAWERGDLGILEMIGSADSVVAVTMGCLENPLRTHLVTDPSWDGGKLTPVFLEFAQIDPQIVNFDLRRPGTPVAVLGFQNLCLTSLQVMDDLDATAGSGTAAGGVEPSQ